MSRRRMTDREQAYWICILFPIFWPFLPALLLCHLFEATGNGIVRLWQRARSYFAKD